MVEQAAQTVNMAVANLATSVSKTFSYGSHTMQKTAAAGVIVNNMERESDDEDDEGDYAEEEEDEIEWLVMESAGEDPDAREEALKKHRKRNAKPPPVKTNRVHTEVNGTSSVATARQAGTLATSTWGRCCNVTAQPFGSEDGSSLKDLFNITDEQVKSVQDAKKEEKFEKLASIVNKDRVINVLKEERNSVAFLGTQKIKDSTGDSFRKSETISCAQVAHKMAGFGTVGVDYAHIDASDISLATNDNLGEDKAGGIMALPGNQKFIRAVEAERLKLLVGAKPEAAFKVMLVEGNFEGRTVLREFLALKWKVFKISHEAFKKVEYVGCEGKIASARAHLQDKTSPYMTSSRGFYICVNEKTQEVRLVIVIFSFCRFPYFEMWLLPDYRMALATINVLRTLQGLEPVSFTNNDLYKVAIHDRSCGKKHLHKKRKVDYPL